MRTELILIVDHPFIVRAESENGWSQHGSGTTVEEAEDKALQRLNAIAAQKSPALEEYLAEQKVKQEADLDRIRKEMNSEFKRLGWKPEQAKELLTKHFQVEKSKDLSYEQTCVFVGILKAYEVGK